MWLAIPLNGGMNEFLIIITGSIFELSSEYDNEDWMLSGWWLHGECEHIMNDECKTVNDECTESTCWMNGEWWTQKWESSKFLGLYDMMTIYLHKLL